MTAQCSALIDELVALRKAKGWTQRDLSAACGIAQPMLTLIENKARCPSMATLAKITQALGVSLRISSDDVQDDEHENV